MAIRLPWGTQNNPTPIRSWIGQNIPGTQGLGNIVGQDPRYSWLNQQVRGVSTAKAAEPTQIITDNRQWSNDADQANMAAWDAAQKAAALKTGGSGATGPVLGAKIDTSTIDSNTATGSNTIDSDYNDFMSQLQGAEGSLNSQSAINSAELQNSYTGKQNAVKQEGATALAGNADQVALAQRTEKTGMQGARDLFRQQQQANIAQTSALGISSSSVTEALAETLGVTMARRVGEVAQSAGDVYQGLAREKSNIETYVKNKLTEAEDWLGTEKQKIQYSLSEGLRQINEARATAAKDKSNRRAELLQGAQNAISTLMTNAQTFQQSLDAWKAQNTTKIQQLMSDTDVAAKINAQAANLNKTYASTGIQYVPGVGSNNEFTGFNTVKTPTDQFGNPITTAAQTTNQPTGQTTGVPQANFNKYPNDGYTY